ncbi:phosphate/phosphite/phosphonate ABC transporter substrate-binding protein [Neptunomonas sp. XY-337]|uniref:phosphate/phosphite/phosphonate ABC transporter substrate-binding protein n=1 Tax=Neptunomonas sp. XY-337 TaxID=2561897 RepID=UPI0010AADBEA|nr:phosphate/phosphite/phosphonate ABC transporter substrate-binding protein [Neptunomonas sp. XY-337]
MKRLVLVLALAFSFLNFAHASEQVYTLGVVPQQSAKKLARLWTPVTQYLSSKTGLAIRFATARDIPTFEKRVVEGEYDIAYMNPYHYTVFSQKPGYRAIAKQKNKQIKGIFVVRDDSPIQSLNELSGQKLAFPSPAAFAASVIPRAQLDKEQIAYEPKYVSSHDSVYRNVAKGFFKAGGGVMRTFNNTAPEVKAQLRVLWTTPGYTPHALAVHPRVSSSASEAIQTALVEMASDPEGAILLKSLNFKQLEAAGDDDWDDVRALNIKLLDHLLSE